MHETIELWGGPRDGDHIHITVIPPGHWPEIVRVIDETASVEDELPVLTYRRTRRDGQPIYVYQGYQP